VKFVIDFAGERNVFEAVWFGGICLSICEKVEVLFVACLSVPRRFLGYKQCPAPRNR
jgi:hypothetical protein